MPQDTTPDDAARDRILTLDARRRQAAREQSELFQSILDSIDGRTRTTIGPFTEERARAAYSNMEERILSTMRTPPPAIGGSALRYAPTQRLVLPERRKGEVHVIDSFQQAGRSYFGDIPIVQSPNLPPGTAYLVDESARSFSLPEIGNSLGIMRAPDEDADDYQMRLQSELWRNPPLTVEQRDYAASDFLTEPGLVWGEQPMPRVTSRVTEVPSPERLPTPPDEEALGSRGVFQYLGRTFRSWLPRRREDRPLSIMQSLSEAQREHAQRLSDEVASLRTRLDTRCETCYGPIRDVSSLPILTTRCAGCELAHRRSRQYDPDETTVNAALRDFLGSQDEIVKNAQGPTVDELETTYRV